MEAPALRLGAESGRIRCEAVRLLLQTTPCKATCIKVRDLANAKTARSELENVLEYVVDRDVHEIEGGGYGPIPVTHVFYRLGSDSQGQGTGSLSSRRPPPLTAAQLDAYVRLALRMRVWAKQALRFVEATTRRSARTVNLHLEPPTAKARQRMASRATAALHKLERGATALLGLKLRATRASILWAIVRVGVCRRWLAHRLFEAKQGVAYAPGGSGAQRDLAAAVADVGLA